MASELQILQDRFPFLTLFQYAGEEMIGVVQNQGKNVVSCYVYNKLTTPEQKKLFLELAQVWWAESNRKIPINLFFRSDFDIFNFCVCNFVAKEFKIISGHSVSLHTLNHKRVKRRRVELIIKDK